MVGCHHWHNGHEFEQILGDSEEQGSLGCCSPLCYKKVGYDLAAKQQQRYMLINRYGRISFPLKLAE